MFNSIHSLWVWAFRANQNKINKSPCASDSLAPIWCLCFTFCPAIWSELHGEPAHPLIHVCVADGTILLYMLVDLLSKINRTVLSADKCTRTYNGAISIIEAILDETQGCLLVDLLVSICVCEWPSISLLSAIQQKFVLLLLARLLAIEYETQQENRYLLFVHYSQIELSFRLMSHLRCCWWKMHVAANVGKKQMHTVTWKIVSKNI